MKTVVCSVLFVVLGVVASLSLAQRPSGTADPLQVVAYDAITIAAGEPSCVLGGEVIFEVNGYRLSVTAQNNGVSAPVCWSDPGESGVPDWGQASVLKLMDGDVLHIDIDPPVQSFGFQSTEGAPFLECNFEGNWTTNENGDRHSPAYTRSGLKNLATPMSQCRLSGVQYVRGFTPRNF